MTKQEAITKLLKTHHAGNEKAINSDNLRYKIDEYYGYFITDDELRDEIPLLIEQGALIGSCDKGFYWIVNEHDLAIAKGTLLSPIQERVKRAKKLDELWNKQNNYQLRLF